MPPSWTGHRWSPRATSAPCYRKQLCWEPGLAPHRFLHPCPASLPFAPFCGGRQGKGGKGSRAGKEKSVEYQVGLLVHPIPAICDRMETNSCLAPCQQGGKAQRSGEGIWTGSRATSAHCGCCPCPSSAPCTAVSHLPVVIHDSKTRLCVFPNDE